MELIAFSYEWPDQGATPAGCGAAILRHGKVEGADMFDCVCEGLYTETKGKLGLDLTLSSPHGAQMTDAVHLAQGVEIPVAVTIDRDAAEARKAIEIDGHEVVMTFKLLRRLTI